MTQERIIIAQKGRQGSLRQ